MRRLRIEIGDALLGPSHREQGLKRSWFWPSHGALSIADFGREIYAHFHLQCAGGPAAMQLVLDGFPLPPDGPMELLRDGDLIIVGLRPGLRAAIMAPAVALLNGAAATPHPQPQELQQPDVRMRSTVAIREPDGGVGGGAGGSGRRKKRKWAGAAGGAADVADIDMADLQQEAARGQEEQQQQQQGHRKEKARRLPGDGDLHNSLLAASGAVPNAVVAAAAHSYDDMQPRSSSIVIVEPPSPNAAAAAAACLGAEGAQPDDGICLLTLADDSRDVTSEKGGEVSEDEEASTSREEDVVKRKDDVMAACTGPEAANGAAATLGRKAASRSSRRKAMKRRLRREGTLPYKGPRAGAAAAVKTSSKDQKRAPFGRKQQTQEKPSPAPVPMPVGGAAIGGREPPKQQSQQHRAEVDRLKPASAAYLAAAFAASPLDPNGTLPAMHSTAAAAVAAAVYVDGGGMAPATGPPLVGVVGRGESFSRQQQQQQQPPRATLVTSRGTTQGSAGAGPSGSSGLTALAARAAVSVAPGDEEDGTSSSSASESSSSSDDSSGASDSEGPGQDGRSDAQLQAVGQVSVGAQQPGTKQKAVAGKAAALSSSSSSSSDEEDDSEDDENDAATAVVKVPDAVAKAPASHKTAPVVPAAASSSSDTTSGSTSEDDSDTSEEQGTSQQQQQQQQQQEPRATVPSSRAHEVVAVVKASRVTVAPITPHIEYDSLPVVQGGVAVGDVLAYKLLEVGFDMCPRVSCWRQCRVLQVEPVSGEVVLQPHPDPRLHPLQADLDALRARLAAEATTGFGADWTAAGRPTSVELDMTSLPFPTEYDAEGLLSTTLDQLADVRAVSAEAIMSVKAVSVEAAGAVRPVGTVPAARRRGATDAQSMAASESAVTQPSVTNRDPPRGPGAPQRAVAQSHGAAQDSGGGGGRIGIEGSGTGGPGSRPGAVRVSATLPSTPNRQWGTPGAGARRPPVNQPRPGPPAAAAAASSPAVATVVRVRTSTPAPGVSATMPGRPNHPSHPPSHQQQLQGAIVPAVGGWTEIAEQLQRRRMEVSTSSGPPGRAADQRLDQAEQPFRLAPAPPPLPEVMIPSGSFNSGSDTTIANRGGGGKSRLPAAVLASHGGAWKPTLEEPYPGPPPLFGDCGEVRQQMQEAEQLVLEAAQVNRKASRAALGIHAPGAVKPRGGVRQVAMARVLSHLRSSGAL